MRHSDRRPRLDDKALAQGDVQELSEDEGVDGNHTQMRNL